MEKELGNFQKQKQKESGGENNKSSINVNLNLGQDWHELAPNEKESRLMQMRDGLGKALEKKIEIQGNRQELLVTRAVLQMMYNELKINKGEEPEPIDIDGLDSNYANELIDMQDKLYKAEKQKPSEKEIDAVEKTKACQKCGRENILSSNFCSSCGNKFENKQEEVTEVEPESSFDKNVGKPALGVQEYQKERLLSQNMKKLNALSESGIDLNDKEAVLKFLNEIEGEKNIQPKEQELETPNELPIAEEEKNLWSESDLEIAATNEENLLSFLDKVDGIQGSGKHYTQEELKNSVKDSLDKLRKIDMKDKDAVNNILKYVTNQGDIKLREKVYQVALKEKLQGM